MTDDCMTLQRRGSWWEDILENRCAPHIGPRNTYSNLAFALAGIVIWLLLQTWSGVVLAADGCFLCWGSWRYHSRKTVADNQLDRAGMFAMYGGITAFALSRVAGVDTPWVALFVLGISALAAWLAWRYPTKRDLNRDLAVVIWPSVLLTWVEGSRLLLVASLLVAGLGFLCWTLDRQRRFPWPRWGHTCWHGCMAVSQALTVAALR